MKTMLDIITLNTLEKIFEERLEHKITPSGKTLYQNCLIFHFKSKLATEKNTRSFHIFKGDVKNYAKFEETFKELENAKLVTIHIQTIEVHNNWGQYIDRLQLQEKDKLNVEESSLQKADYFFDQLTSNQTLIDVTGMKHRIKKEIVKQMIELFVSEQKAIGTRYAKTEECAKHFMNWATYNIPMNEVKTEIVKSSSKILGKE
jgi:hypothetical protein